MVWVGERTWGRGQWGVSLTLIQLLTWSFGGVSAISPVFFGEPCFQVGTQGSVLILDFLGTPTKGETAGSRRPEGGTRGVGTGGTRSPSLKPPLMPSAMLGEQGGPELGREASASYEWVCGGMG